MLEIKNLHVSVDGKEILRGIDLSIQPGEIQTFTLFIGCAQGATCDASDFAVGTSDGSIPVLGAMLFIRPGEDAAFGGTNAIVPEPVTASLLALGLIGLAIVGRRRH